MEERLKKLLEVHEVIQAVNDIFIYLDKFDWENFLNCFADELEDDYSSVFKVGVNRVKHEHILERWEYLNEFESLFHSLSNHKVNIHGKEADCYCYVYSMQFLPNEISEDDNWIAAGYYDIHLIKTNAGWKTNKIKFTAAYIDGVGVLKKLGLYDKLLEKWK